MNHCYHTWSAVCLSHGTIYQPSLDQYHRVDQDQLFLSAVTMRIVPWRAGAALEGKGLIDKARANDTAAVCCYHSPIFIVRLGYCDSKSPWCSCDVRQTSSGFCSPEIRGLGKSRVGWLLLNPMMVGCLLDPCLSLCKFNLHGMAIYALWLCMVVWVWYRRTLESANNSW